ncbi:MAG TPA: YbhB/YbcL family Raf kinase inhibitor-like protein [Xanthobacteraceae bacterium]|nr:YbhB/YbcL family Raf kinase inhibitor-like protein [Xanthobacteraceae bacterium]
MRGLVEAALCAGGLAAACLAGSGAAHAVDHPDLFEVASPDFPDNGMLSEAHAGVGKSLRGPWACGGQNQSPALSWSHAPAETKSFAIIMDDPDAASGRGGNHWIMYDIPPTTVAVARGEANQPGRFVSGNSGNNAAYHGACAEPGAKAHHFIFLVYALDIPLGQLKPGLTKAEFMREIQGHNLAEASIVARYQRAADGKALLSSK